MTDIFREVEEEVRRERLEKLWKKYGDFVIAGVAVVMLSVAGYELWQRHETSVRETASAQFNAALKLAGNDPAAAIQKFDYLAKTAPTGYATLAKFLEADTLLATGDRNKAIELYRSLGSGDDGLISAAARLRAAWSIVDLAPRDTVAALVDPLSHSSWRYLVNEVLAYSDYRAGLYVRAEIEYNALVGDPQIPATLHARAKSMVQLIRAGGLRDYGTVPKPEGAPPGDAPPKP